MASRRIPFVDVYNRPGSGFWPILDESQADAIGRLRVADLRRAAGARARNAATEAAGRHYAATNYR